MSSILVTGRDKARLQKHYLPALRLGGWEGDLRVVVPGDVIPPLEAMAALFLTGGDDIHPRAWDPGEPLHPTAEPDLDRDALELPLAREAWNLGIPVLGICRGAQVLNVALGGSLIQDIPSALACDPRLHRQGHADIPEPCHRVSLAPGSRMAHLLGMVEVGVNSRHHQSVQRLGAGLKAVGWSETPDRVIEAVEAEDPACWVFGVQWHPENLVSRTDEVGAASKALFQAFIDAARRFR